MKKIKLLSLVIGLMLCTASILQAQMTLTGSSYTQSFDSIGTGYPTGWTVGKTATASALGTSVTLTTTKTAWKSNSGGAFNYASATGLTIADTTNLANQTASTNRALGFRQTGNNGGDSGAVFMFQIANTTGLSAFNFAFKLQSLDNAVIRATTWKVQYAFGATPSTFTDATTTPAPLTTGGSTWGSTNVSVNFGAALDNNAGPVWIRIVALTKTVGSGSRPVTAIDDVNLTWTSAVDATLSNLTVNGTTVAGFAPTTYSYNVGLPSGTTTVPTIVGTPNTVGATVEYAHPLTVPGVDSIKVTATDGTTKALYLINYTVTAANDATLSDLKVNGTTVTGFASSTYSYNVTLPYGTTVVPTITATPTDGNATIVYVPATSLTGVDSVKVTAQDGTTKLNYTIQYTVALNSDATLSDLKVNGTTITGFASATHTYNVALPYGTTTVPTVLATPTDANATVVYVNPAALPGNDTIKVTAQDGIAKITYIIRFTIAQNTDASLSDLTVNGTTVTGFSPTIYTYNVELPYGTTVVPTVVGVATDVTNAVVTYKHATALPGVDSVKVRAQNFTIRQNYIINFTLAAPQTFSVNFNVVGTNGTLAATVDAAPITSPAMVVIGKNVVFTATPDANYIVKQWTVDGTVVSGNVTNTYTLSNLAATSTVTVEFKSSVGISEVDANSVTVYPIPANNLINLKMNTTINKVEVLNVNGQVVIETIIDKNEGTLNTSMLSNGMYFLRITNTNGISMKKIQISK